MKPAKGVFTLYSNSPTAPTGYGVQAELLLSAMQRDGYEVAAISNYGHEGVIGEWDSGHGSIPVYPRGMDAYSNDVLALNHLHFANQFDAPNVLLTLYDTWVINAPSTDKTQIGSWTPIDHAPIPPKVLAWCQKPNVTPIAMSKFGLKELERHGVEAEYVPHGVQTNIFKPGATVQGVSGREFLKTEDVFAVGIFGANKAGGNLHRKALGENFFAFAIFAEKHPDAVLYLHTDVYGSQGWGLMKLAEACGIPLGQIRLVDQVQYRFGISREDLAGIYTGIDVLLATSYGEGFGVPTIEAQACGVPVIVSDWAASPELVGEGWKVDGQPLWDDVQKSWFFVPNIARIVNALEEAYKRGKGVSEEAVAFASQYDAKKIYSTYWKPVLKRLLAKG